MIQFAEGLEEKDEQRIEELFRVMDGQGRGYVTSHELGPILRALGLDCTPARVKVLFRTLDTNRDGHLTMSEFLAGVRWIGQAASFRAASPNGCAAAMQSAASAAVGSPAAARVHLSASSLAAAFAKADLQSAGHIGAAELRKMLATVVIGAVPDPAEVRWLTLVLERQFGDARGQYRSESVAGLLQGLYLGFFLAKRAAEDKKEPLWASLESENELRRMREIFELCDVDGNGAIDPTELAMVMDEMGVAATDEQIADLFERLDRDGDRRISFDEFARGMRDLVATSGRLPLAASHADLRAAAAASAPPPSEAQRRAILQRFVVELAHKALGVAATTGHAHTIQAMLDLVNPQSLAQLESALALPERALATDELCLLAKSAEKRLAAASERRALGHSPANPRRQ